jgi:hypothetical protein
MAQILPSSPGTCRSIAGNRGTKPRRGAGDPQQYATDYPHGPGEGAENPGGTGQGLVAQLTHRSICRSSSARLSKCLQITIVLLQHAMVMLTSMAVYRRLRAASRPPGVRQLSRLARRAPNAAVPACTCQSEPAMSLAFGGAASDRTRAVFSEHAHAAFSLYDRLSESDF